MLNKSKLEIEESVLKYVKKELAKDRFPKYKEIKKLFKTDQNKIKLSEIYFKLGFDILNFPIKRPNNSSSFLKEKLITYVKLEIAKNHYPSRRELENKFRVRLSGLFDGIEDLYLRTGSKYLQKSSQKLKLIKSTYLLDITLEDILPKLNLTLIKYHKSYQHGFDILTSNIHDKIILIELKAYNKFEPIKQKDIDQVKRFLEQNKSDDAIIITTTQKIQGTVKIPNNIRLILFDELRKIVDVKHQKKIKFIRSFSVHREVNEIEGKRNKIIQYAKERYSSGEDFSYSSVLKDLHIDTRTCFDSIYEIYKEAGVPFPIKRMRSLRSEIHEKATNELKEKILQYVKEQVEKGRYPSGVEVGKKFGISHIWNIVKMSEIYHSLDLPAYHERKKRKTVISSPLT